MTPKKFLFVFFSLILFILSFQAIVLADGPSVATWYGNAYIGTNTTTTGANVSAWINGVIKDSFIVGVDFCGSGCTTPTYMLDVPCSQGDSVTLTIYNVTNSSKTCYTGTRTLLNLTITPLTDTAVCAYSEACSGGYCCSGATEYHGNGIGACQATACSAPAAAVVTSGGGGGGGGAVSEGVSQSKYSGVIGAGSTKELTYTKEELKITGIEITAASQIDNAGITVKESSASKAGIAISTTEGGTYKYLEITKTLITDAQISKVKISFKVEKSWYTANNNDAATTVLRRKVGDAWQDLPTTKLSEDATYYYFEAESTGLSYFAVVAKKVGAAVIPPAEKKAVCGDGVCEYNETCSNCVSDCACGTGKECVDAACKEKAVVPAEKPINKAKLILIGIGILIVFGIVILLLTMPKKKKKI